MSKKQSRRLAVSAQGFVAARGTNWVTPVQFKNVLDTMSCIQLDAVPAVVRTQYMPVYSRAGLYPCEWLDSIAYRKDRWYETFSHEACLLPVHMYPLMRWASERAKHGELRQSGLRLAQEQPTM